MRSPEQSALILKLAVEAIHLCMFHGIHDPEFRIIRAVVEAAALTDLREALNAEPIAT